MTKFEASDQVFQVVPRSSHVTKYDFTWDQKTNVLHLVDLGERGTFSVLHALNHTPMEFIVNLRIQFDKLFKFKLPNFDFRIFVYTHDSLAFEFDDGQLIPIELVDFNKLHVEYLRRRGTYKNVYIE